MTPTAPATALTQTGTPNRNKSGESQGDRSALVEAVYRDVRAAGRYVRRRDIWRLFNRWGTLDAAVISFAQFVNLTYADPTGELAVRRVTA